MHIRIAALFLSFIFIISGFQCEQEGKPVTEIKDTPAVKPKVEIPSVCIYDITPVKMEPAQKGRWISSLELGEKVIWLNEEKADVNDSNKKYLKIRLSDGKEGWVPENTLAIDSRPAVVIRKCAIYLRPDLVTITNKEYAPMEFVAVSKLENEWCEAKGREGEKRGWIKSETISLKDNDIAVALMADKAFKETSKDKKKEKLEAIISNPLFADALFIDTLKYQLSKIPPWDDEEEPLMEGLDDSEEY